MLYRKYRPQDFAQIIGQEHVVKTLQGALTSGRIGHAYLFAGPRGTGKTTMARIFAKAANCTMRAKDGNPCNACNRCIAVMEGRSLDLIEIDAASNRGIDEIRSVKESASVAALGGGYKVFLIDEVHMLTKDAFNALLKVLEEPPAHIIFILATTEAHKILPTVLSRVQRFDFKKLSHVQIAQKLADIARQEKIKIDDDALAALAAASDGALRDAEVAFTKVLAALPKGKNVTALVVQELLGLIPMHYYPELLGYLAAHDRARAIDFIQRITSAGVDLEHFGKEFLEYLRKVLVHRINPATLAAVGQELVGEHAKVLVGYAQQIEPKILVAIITAFTTARARIKDSPVPQLPFELAIIEITT